MTHDDDARDRALIERLFEMARSEQPSPDGAERALRNMAAAALSTSLLTTVGNSHASTLAFGAIAKWFGVGALAGVATLGGASQLLEPRAADQPRRLRSSSLSSTHVRLPAPKHATPPSEPPASEPAPRAAAPRPPRSRGSLPQERSHLAEEVNMLERARRALHGGEFTVAAKALDSYAALFPGGALAAEAAYLRMELHFRSGDRDRAKQAARELLRRHPNSPQAARARAVAGIPNL